MKKFYPFYLFIPLIFFIQSASAQVLSFSLAGSDGNEAFWPSTTNAASVQPSSLIRGSGVVPAANADRFNSTNWSTGSSIDLTDYLEFVLTPTAGYALNVTSILLQHQRSTTGPTKFVIRTSLDNYAGNATNTVAISDVNTFQNHSFAFAYTINSTAPVTIRIYAYAAETATGTWGPGVGGDDEVAVFGSLHILPIKFGNLKAIKKAQTIEVSFSNLTESDIVAYAIERSSDGLQFNLISKMAPLKNDGGNAEYTFMDALALRSANFYRVKTVEKSGKIFYSYIVKVNMEMVQPGISIYPNPVVAKQLGFQVNDLTTGTYKMVVHNTIGQIVHQISVKHEGGSFGQTIPLNNLRAGIYYLEFYGKEKLVKRFIVE
jgi:hypothetical protein